jgi:4-hydroxymandelate oxidase
LVATSHERSGFEADSFVNAEELEGRAQAILPKDTYDYIAGGAEDEAALAANREAYARYRFRFKILSGAGEPDLSLELLGTRLTMPVLLAPTATQRLAHPEGELAVSRAAADAGVLFCVSTLATTSLEAVAAAAPGHRWFQLYVHRDRGLTRELLQRAAAAGYLAVALTADTPVLGRRERDLRNAFTLHADLSYGNLTGALANTTAVDPGDSGLARYFDSQLEDRLTWSDLAWLIATSPLPVAVKGVVRGDDARRCLELGARCLIVSNHGGRQLDYSIATLDALPEVLEAVGTGVPVCVDGGVRRGSDVLKALALGARAILIGRPYLWALAVGGEAGVRRLLALLRTEIATSMTLLGVGRLSDLSPDLVVRS